MKAFTKTTYISMTIATMMTACGTDTTDNSANKAEKVQIINATHGEEIRKAKILEQENNKDRKRLEEGILVYGQGIKGDFSTKSIQEATYKESNKNFGIVTAKIEVKNIRKDKKPYDLSEFKYFVRDSKTGDTFKGEAIPSSLEKFENLPSNTTIKYDIAFKVKKKDNLNNNYLYIDSDIEPSSRISWHLNGLTKR
ncbi:hypothetical protein NLI92_002801 [Priestia megaterium]|uniref:hypothetical protein n=1 Tax=Priestia megaterium TaxID=1404 RepID=UPI0021AC77D6|nr:hypothetical protein [Priestia megaterium]MCR8927417.1 hypothetical protein [Priestia megaterium]